jgi:hypothetical protein
MPIGIGNHKQGGIMLEPKDWEKESSKVKLAIDHIYEALRIHLVMTSEERERFEFLMEQLSADNAEAEMKQDEEAKTDLAGDAGAPSVD